MDAQLEALSVSIGQALQQRQWQLTCAESCTGGWVGEVITATAGSSQWFDRGFITYSNLAKQEMLGVPADLLQRFGAVSEETARAMAIGALQHAHAQVSLAITGIAGPGGGSSSKPVGTVCFAWCATVPSQANIELSASCCFSGSREAVRRQAVVHALEGLAAFLLKLPTAKFMP